jgi:hypothetical protein
MGAMNSVMTKKQFKRDTDIQGSDIAQKLEIFHVINTVNIPI